jgi:phosphatidylinositol dimannoside acyltransferase
MLRLGLELADRLVNLLPSHAAYALADLGGDLWLRLAPGRRRLVAANLARVCAATERPTRGPAFTALVRATFRNHARYYVELLRAPRYATDRIDEHVRIPDWEALLGAMRSRPGVLVSPHLGNFEPFGTFLTAHVRRPLAPVEVIEPRALFEFIAARRGSGNVDLVPLQDASRALVRRLRDGGIVGIVGDRDLAGDGQPVTFFGHSTTVPTGPAALALMHDAVLVVGRCLRVGPDRFEVHGRTLELPRSGDRRADVAELTRRIAAYFEEDIGAAPEQWWGAFQPYWPDLSE